MEIGTVHQVDIDRQMRSAYLDYAMSVIVSRALPDARDGLKPVHRRILYSMYDLSLRSTSAFKKSARIVGDVLGKYHPHGDTAVYDAMARMAQNFSMRYPLINGQGNFGSIDGDAPAAMRYTEARLGAMAEEMLSDIEKETVSFIDNFDGSLQEPSVLPSRLPNLLLNGASGIAVGMATNIPPHNLRELTAALLHLIDNYDTLDDVPLEDLLQFIPGPDFPTGGMIIGAEGIRQAYSSGRGHIVLRGTVEILEADQRIVITEIPFQVNKSSLIERIAELVRAERISGISDLRDESDQNGMSIVIELKRGANASNVRNQLYKHTPLQSTVGVHMLALVNGEPRVLPLKIALEVFIEHRVQVTTRRSEFDLRKARARRHILDGLLIALGHLDEVIQTIRQSPDAETAKQRLITRFRLSELQAQAILDMQLRRLAALERQKIEDEHRHLSEQIGYLEALLADPHKTLDVIRGELVEMADKYGDERRTRIATEARQDFSEEDLIENVPVLVSITQRGYIKRVASQAFRTQNPGGRGVQGQATREEDEVVYFFPACTLDTILFFSNKGKVYSTKAYQIPDANRTSRGVSVRSVLNFNDEETVTAAVAVPDFKTANYCTMVTRNGRSKRMVLSEFESIRQSGVIAITLDKDDELHWVRLTKGDDDVILVSEQGQAVRFNEQEVRAMGRVAAGVSAIKLRKGDHLASMEVVEPGGDLLIVTARGYGKRTPLSEYTAKSRATGGVATINREAISKIGKITAARVVQEADDLTIISTNGIVLRTNVADISRQGRATRGVVLMHLQEGDSIASLARIAKADLE
ncbi:MAG: DNA gyrase subunit A [Anaerolineales bacterium]|nr:DNA gyrase subunit A [Anaerolineales bacterium]